MKKIKTTILLIVLFAFAINLSSQENTSSFSSTENMNYEIVSNSVILLHNDKQYGSNITCVSLDDGLVFIDCGMFIERAAKFRKDMEDKFKKKTLALVLSHSHVDHFFGMAAFEDVPIIASYSSEANYARQLKIDFQQYVEGYKSVFQKLLCICLLGVCYTRRWRCCWLFFCIWWFCVDFRVVLLQ